MDGWNFRGTGEKKKNEAKLSSLLLLLFFVSIILKSILLKMLRSSSSNVSFFERISLSFSLSLSPIFCRIFEGYFPLYYEITINVK